MVKNSKRGVDMEKNGVSKAKKAKNIAAKRIKKENKEANKAAKKKEKKDRKDIRYAYTKALKKSSPELFLSVVAIILTIIPIGLDYYNKSREKKGE